MNKPVTLKFSRRNLPHWLVAERSYFVTLRVKGSLPGSVVAGMQKERSRADNGEHVTQLQREHFKRVEAILDAVDADYRPFDTPEVAALLIENLDWLRNQGWTIYAATVLSTHIHLLMRNEKGRSSELMNDLGQYKNFTAGRINKLLDRTVSLWARELFDHWIRTPEKFERTVRYIAQNPVKAGRVRSWDKWPWTVVHDDALYCLEPSTSKRLPSLSWFSRAEGKAGCKE